MDVDMKGLCDEFEMENAEIEQIEIEKFKDVLNEIKKIEDPTVVLSAIIEKAGSFLDMIEKECVNGNMGARYMESAATIINSLIQAATSVAHVESIWYNDRLKEVRIQQKNREIDQKDKELDIKKLYYENKLLTDGSKTTNNNVILTDRQEVLKFLKNKQE